MEKKSVSTTSITENELENITGGGNFEDGDSYGEDICATCGKSFRGSCYSLKAQEEEHFNETGHSVFRPND
ncbi:MAG: hypothetical protein ACERKN_16145 [Velocimicrobium sp.]